MHGRGGPGGGIQCSAVSSSSGGSRSPSPKRRITRGRSPSLTGSYRRPVSRSPIRRGGPPSGLYGYDSSRSPPPSHLRGMPRRMGSSSQSPPPRRYMTAGGSPPGYPPSRGGVPIGPATGEVPHWLRELRLAPNVKSLFETLYQRHKLQPGDLDPSCVTHLEALPTLGAMQVLEELASLDLSRIRNVTAFFIGICRRVSGRLPPPIGRPMGGAIGGRASSPPPPPRRHSMMDGPLGPGRPGDMRGLIGRGGGMIGRYGGDGRFSPPHGRFSPPHYGSGGFRGGPGGRPGSPVYGRYSPPPGGGLYGNLGLYGTRGGSPMGGMRYSRGSPRYGSRSPPLHRRRLSRSRSPLVYRPRGLAHSRSRSRSRSPSGSLPSSVVNVRPAASGAGCGTGRSGAQATLPPPPVSPRCGAGASSSVQQAPAGGKALASNASSKPRSDKPTKAQASETAGGSTNSAAPVTTKAAVKSSSTASKGAVSAAATDSKGVTAPAAVAPSQSTKPPSSATEAGIAARRKYIEAKAAKLAELEASAKAGAGAKAAAAAPAAQPSSQPPPAHTKSGAARPAASAGSKGVMPKVSSSSTIALVDMEEGEADEVERKQEVAADKEARLALAELTALFDAAALPQNSDAQEAAFLDPEGTGRTLGHSLSQKGASGQAPSVLRLGLTAFVKDLLQPGWKSKSLTRGAFKAVARSAVDQVLFVLPNAGAGSQYDSATGLGLFMSEARKEKIRALVQATLACH